MIPETSLSLKQIAELSALAGGIIPADERDAGAALVHAGPGIAARIRFNPFASIYIDGLSDARRWSEESFGCGVESLDTAQVDALLKHLREHSHAFFRQLRSDVCLLYLSDPGVWQRIGFPGASSDHGYPDFDQPPS